MVVDGLRVALCPSVSRTSNRAGAPVIRPRVRWRAGEATTSATGPLTLPASRHPWVPRAGILSRASVSWVSSNEGDVLQNRLGFAVLGDDQGFPLFNSCVKTSAALAEIADWLDLR